ncbi:sporulation protein YhbH [Microaerobacter geothermalis]|uniref:sporulation protein YhbH n=1 Tax=Microaerobacter geothermalis TaxID=674972 RepID=UPI001F33DBC0|nr:sporulation protein YhbH [Microaerobacter geothermalis]MCF6093687.1 sporulation protein YhbH [Microaerobacter geothermalis]
MEKHHPLFILSQEDWSLHRKGYADQERHKKKVKDAIRKNLAEIVSEESIILSNGKDTIKVPIRSIEQFRFKFNLDKQKHVGQGQGDSQVGDVLGRANDGAGQGQGNEQAGNQPGQDYYEAEITVDELAELIFEDLSLPNLKNKEKNEIYTQDITFDDIRKKGLMGNIDKKRTLLAHLKRTQLDGCVMNRPIHEEDLRFKTWNEVNRPETNAIIMAMMDTSGSMGSFEKYIARSFFFWMTRFLRTRYQRVEIVFIAHHTEAKEVTEEQFFTKGESGGTRCSSAYQLALELIENRYPPQRYNIYPFHFSDGDNWSDDNPLALSLLNKLLEVSNMVGYGEIGRRGSRSTLMHLFHSIDHPRFTQCLIEEKKDVYMALKTFFGMKEGGAA